MGPCLHPLYVIGGVQFCDLTCSCVYCNFKFDDDCFYYHSWRNNVEIAFGTLFVFSYLASHSEWRCLRCLSFCRWWKTGKHSCRSSVISMRSCPPQYPRSSTPIKTSSPSLFFVFLFPPFPVFFFCVRACACVSRMYVRAYLAIPCVSANDNGKHTKSNIRYWQ